MSDSYEALHTSTDYLGFMNKFHSRTNFKDCILVVAESRNPDNYLNSWPLYSPQKKNKILRISNKEFAAGHFEQFPHSALVDS